MQIVLENFNLDAAERLLCEAALDAAGSIVEAAPLLGTAALGVNLGAGGPLPGDWLRRCIEAAQARSAA